MGGHTIGAFIIFRITFKERKEMIKFVKKYRPLILVEDNTPADFTAWRYLWKPNTIICFMGFCGYEEPKDYKKELKGKIYSFSWIPINDLDSRWRKK